MRYFVLFLITLAFTFYAQIKVSTTFKKYSGVRTSRGITGRQAADMVLMSGNVTGVDIVSVAGELTDNFNSHTMKINLSAAVYGSESVAASGVAAHEAGHAIQHSTGYLPVKIRNALVPVCSITSRLTTPLIFTGLLISYLLPEVGGFLIELAAICFAVAVLFQAVTLPAEFNASGRALTIMRASGYYTEEELEGARRVLTAAALTYVAAMAASVVQLLRLLSMVNGRRK